MSWKTGEYGKVMEKSWSWKKSWKINGHWKIMEMYQLAKSISRVDTINSVGCISWSFPWFVLDSNVQTDKQTSIGDKQSIIDKILKLQNIYIITLSLLSICCLECLLDQVVIQDVSRYSRRDSRERYTVGLPHDCSQRSHPQTKGSQVCPHECHLECRFVLPLLQSVVHIICRR